jgi:HAMP domain-containing protein
VAGFTLVAAGIMLLVLVVVTMEFRISRRSQALTTARQELQTLESSARRTEALARNLDLLGKLAAEQPQLHAILRELAANLPETVFLDAVHYNRLADRGILELVTVTDSAVALGEDQALSAIVNTVRRSPRLALDNDPVIAMVKEGGRRLVQVTVVCTVVPPGGSGR